MKVILSIALLFSVFVSHAQNTPMADKGMEKRLKKHIVYLASEKLEGRGTGTKGNELAAQYLEKEFKKIGLSVERQPFEVTTSVTSIPQKVEINGVVLQHGIDYYPIEPSGMGNVTAATIWLSYGIQAAEFQHNDFKDSAQIAGKIAVIRLGSPGGCSPHGKWGNYLEPAAKVALAKKYGAVGVIFLKDSCEEPTSKFETKLVSNEIPVIYLSDTGRLKCASKMEWDNGKATMSVSLKKNSVPTQNVVAYLNNNAPFTVVLGAHYDHLGHGEMGGSLYRGPKAVHYGADDNASGTAGLLELARTLKNNPNFTKYNVVFAAFSGEELGLLGSKKYVESPIFTELPKISYMINMDMIGRLHENQLTLSGFGTSPSWLQWVDTTFGGMKCKLEYSGVGPSDHTSFYLKDIPVLAFFTNAHADYHKPTDVAEKINYVGEVMILQDVLNTLEKSNGKATFTKTKDQSNRTGARFSVSLGIIPDYAFEGLGVKVDGVSDGKAGQKAGIKTGDIVLSLGKQSVSDIQVYMKILAGFKKGDATEMEVLRGKETLRLSVQF
jgi:hypothetical protein